MNLLSMIIALTIPLMMLQKAFGAPGTTGAQVLEIAPGARAAGMGGAFCAVADDSDSIYYNPAGLVNIRSLEIPLSNSELFGGVRHNYAALVYNLRDIRTSNIENLGTIAIGSTLLDKGQMVSRDGSGLAGDTFKAMDSVILVSYGRPLFEGGSLGQVAIGVSGKFFEEEIRNISNKSQAFDGGILWQGPKRCFSLGVAVLNMGNKVDFKQEGFDLPANVKAGIAYRTTDRTLTLAADLNNPLRGSMAFNLGAEYQLARAVVLRGGYDSRGDYGSGVAMGLGVMLKDLDVFFFFTREMDIDYAFIPSSDLGDMHKMSLIFKIGAE